MGKLTDRRRFHCGECDDWKPRIECPDCGQRCTVYIRSFPKPAAPAALTGAPTHDR